MKPEKQIIEENILFNALRTIGMNDSAREKFTQLIIEIENKLILKNISVRDQITGPIIDSIYSECPSPLRKKIKSGLVFDFYYNSKISREFIMSSQLKPDHVWEPQTTRVLEYFSTGAKNVIVGGAYFGDQALIIAHQMKQNGGICHAFEPNQKQISLLNQNILNNKINNLKTNKLALWSENDTILYLGEKSKNSLKNKSVKPFSLIDEGNFSTIAEKDKLSYNHSKVTTTTIDNYGKEYNLEEINLIMLDLEGGEIKALKGAERYLNKKHNKPVIIFEIHKHYENWDSGLNNTRIVKYLKSFGYSLFAIRDYQGNVNMAGHPIELIPSDNVYLEGPPHGFNMLAIEDVSQLNDDFVFTHNVSPKLLKHKDPNIHQPLH